MISKRMARFIFRSCSGLGNRRRGPMWGFLLLVKNHSQQDYYQVCGPSQHLQESPASWPEIAKTKISKSFFGGSTKDPGKYPGKSKNAPKSPTVRTEEATHRFLIYPNSFSKSHRFRYQSAIISDYVGFRYPYLSPFPLIESSGS